MPKLVERSVQRQLQRVVGDRGHVAPYRYRTDGVHRSVGWYASPSPAQPGCTCPFCGASRAGDEVYLGYRLIDAIVWADRAANEHQEAPA